VASFRLRKLWILRGKLLEAAGIEPASNHRNSLKNKDSDG
jgi:hypothetical protein